MSCGQPLFYQLAFYQSLEASSFNLPPNDPLYTDSKIMRNVMGSATKSEIGATYLNGQESVPIHTTLTKMGHPQSPNPIQVDNSTAEGFSNQTI